MKSFYLSLGIFAAVCLFYFFVVLPGTGDRYVYMLDDTYIHLAVAKHFAQDGVWGITKYLFSSTSSSPLFTFLISACIAAFGNSEFIPLYMNAGFGVALVYLLSQYFLGYFTKTAAVVAAVLFTIFFAVMHLQLLSGMEHVLQVLLVVANVFALRICLNENFANRNAKIAFLGSLSLLGLARFEMMFYFVALAFVFILVKRFGTALRVLIFGFLPVLVFMYFNKKMGGYYFPNSVLVKGTQFDFSQNIFGQIWSIFSLKIFKSVTFYKTCAIPLATIAVLVYRSYVKDKNFRNVLTENLLPIVCALTMVQHALFAEFKGFFRYEAYLLTMWAMALLPMIPEFIVDFKKSFFRDKLIGGLAVFALLLGFYKVWFAHKMLYLGPKNIYQQQIQTAKFLNTYYNKEKVVANDIGAITYFSDIHLLDFVGLGSVEMVPFNEKNKIYDEKFRSFLETHSEREGYRLAMVYEKWLRGQVPRNWKKVAVLTIEGDMSVAQPDVAVYAIDPTIVNELKKNIRAFHWDKNVRVKILN